MTFVEADGVRLNVREDGPSDGPALLFCNSLGTDLHMWDPQAAAMADRFRVVRFDARGHGRSDVPPGPYTLEGLGRDAVAVLDGLGIAHASVCGISQGGQVAMWLAAAHPERIDRAVFASTATRIGTTDAWDVRIRLVREEGMARVATMAMGRFFTDRFREEHPEIVRPMADRVASMSADGYAASCRAVRDADLSDMVGSIRAPSLIVVGRLDPGVSTADAARLRASIPGGELEVLEDASHLGNLEQPERFTALVQRFVDRSNEEDR
jgi:3-oxoadipate enol-lactonase